MYKVVIDPGHGGADRSNVGYSKKYIEADGVLDISLKLRSELLSTGQFQVTMTRDRDVSVALRERGYIAGRIGADLFISEHTDAGAITAGGTTVFYSVDISSDKALAAKMSSSISSVIGISDRGAKIRESLTTPGEDYYGVIDAAQDSGCKHVLLVENAFHSNPNEEQLLLSDSCRLKIAKAQASVICSFFGVSYGGETFPAATSSSHPVIRKGSSGAAVAELQSKLNKIGKYGLVEDGDFGPATEIAVKGFQSKYGLSADGIVGPATWRKIDALIAEINKPITSPVTYRVRKAWSDAASQLGAFGELENAKKCVDAHPGYFAYDPSGNQIYPEIVSTPTPALTPYRVKINWTDPITLQKNAYNVLDNAKACADEFAAEGYKVFDNTGKIVYIGQIKVAPPTAPPTTPPEPPKEYPRGTAIMGPSKSTVAQMATFLKAKNPNPKIDVPVEDFCKMYLEEGEAEGVTGDIAFCQSIKETGWFNFEGDVTPDTHNYAGLGATGGINGNGFVDARTGIRAQIQHLKAYGSTDDLNNECVDARFKYVKRGRAPYWEWLGKMENPKNVDGTYVDPQGWAVPEDTYGHDIISIYNKLLQTTPELPTEPPVESKPQEPTITPPEKTEPPTEPTSEDMLIVKIVKTLFGLFVQLINILKGKKE